MRRGRGLGANDLILFNTASCINTYSKAAKKPGVKDDFGSNITAVLCNCLASGQFQKWDADTQRTGAGERGRARTSAEKAENVDFLPWKNNSG
jgi:hypothetical protein